jgi:hypothetical protein
VTFTEIIRIKVAVRARDGNRCLECQMTEAEHQQRWGRALEVHRVVPGSLYSVEPGVCRTLCKNCHGPQPKRPKHTYDLASDAQRVVCYLPADVFAALQELLAETDRTLTAEIRRAIKSHLVREGALPDPT